MCGSCQKQDGGVGGEGRGGGGPSRCLSDSGCQGHLTC